MYLYGFIASIYRESLLKPKLILLIRRAESHTLEKILREVLLGFIVVEIRVYE